MLAVVRRLSKALMGPRQSQIADPLVLGNPE